MLCLRRVRIVARAGNGWSKRDPLSQTRIGPAARLDPLRGLCTASGIGKRGSRREGLSGEGGLYFLRSS